MEDEGRGTEDEGFQLLRRAVGSNELQQSPASACGGLAGKLDETNTPQIDGPNSPASLGQLAILALECL